MTGCEPSRVNIVGALLMSDGTVCLNGIYWECDECGFMSVHEYFDCWCGGGGGERIPDEGERNAA